MYINDTVLDLLMTNHSPNYQDTRALYMGIPDQALEVILENNSDVRTRERIYDWVVLVELGILAGTMLGGAISNILGYAELGNYLLNDGVLWTIALPMVTWIGDTVYERTGERFEQNVAYDAAANLLNERRPAPLFDYAAQR